MQSGCLFNRVNTVKVHSCLLQVEVREAVDMNPVWNYVSLLYAKPMKYL